MSHRHVGCHAWLLHYLQGCLQSACWHPLLFDQNGVGFLINTLLKSAKIFHYRQTHSENFPNFDFFDQTPTLTIFQPNCQPYDSVPLIQFLTWIYGQICQFLDFWPKWSWGLLDRLKILSWSPLRFSTIENSILRTFTFSSIFDPDRPLAHFSLGPPWPSPSWRPGQAIDQPGAQKVEHLSNQMQKLL